MSLPPQSSDNRHRIGWREVIALPDWGIKRLRAKSDTGARSSAIDVTNIRELPGDRVRFHVRLSRNHPERTRPVEAKVVRRTRVKSSNGHAHERIVVETTVAIGLTDALAKRGHRFLGRGGGALSRAPAPRLNLLLPLPCRWPWLLLLLLPSPSFSRHTGGPAASHQTSPTLREDALLKKSGLTSQCPLLS